MTIQQKLVDTLAASEIDGRTIGEMIAEDTEYSDVVVDAVTETFERDGKRHHAILFDGSWGTTLTGADPKPGDRIRLYGPRFGDRHGWALNDELVEWKTPLERVVSRLEWLAEHDRTQRERFEAERPELNKKYAALPRELRARIDRFRAAEPAFRVSSEAYEMFACTEAAKFADRARAAAATGQDRDDVDAFWASDELRARAAGGDVAGTSYAEPPTLADLRWLLWASALASPAYDYDQDRQRAALDYDRGHSGNTFGGAMHLAAALLTGKEV